MKTLILSFVAVLSAFPLYATPAEDAAAQEKELMLLRAKKRVEQLAAQDKLANEAAKKAAAEERKLAGAIVARITVVQVLDGGILANSTAKRVAQVKEVVEVDGKGLDSHKKFKQVRDVPVLTDADYRLKEIFFLRCDTKGLTDGAEIVRRFWETGTHRYPSVNGSMRTVRAFSTTYVPPEP